MAKVFVTQAVRSLNFSTAEHFGEVVFLTDREYRPEPTPLRFNQDVTDDIVRGMKDYIPGEDFLCTTGSSLPNVVAGACLSKGTHKMLKWNNRAETYELFTVKV